MKMKLKISSAACHVVTELQAAGYEAYIVGGAIRDLLLDRTPKDFDIGCSATPEEVRQVFGRRNARIIGKRFRLTHVTSKGELFEVSTFRKAPVEAGRNERALPNEEELPENLIVSDNSWGTAVEDAWRRDFTVNALFYDPVNGELYDHTGMGLADIKSQTVRAIGEPALRFEEDPVRMLRALKLVGQFDFTLESATENALFSHLELLKLASPSRLALELEKIFGSCCGDRHLRAFYDYGLLEHFLPELYNAWGSAPMERALALLYERNCRLDEGRYRNSVSLAMACVALPFVEEELGIAPGEPIPVKKSGRAINKVLENIFLPLHMMIRLNLSAEKVLSLQTIFDQNKCPQELYTSRSYPNARELKIIRTSVDGGDPEQCDREWPLPMVERSRDRGKGRKGAPRRRSHAPRGGEKN
jgi:poly(A) polymerase